jgi:hypothetical protein
MKKTRKTISAYKKLHIKGIYQDFTDFYDINKNKIYNAMFDVFEGFRTTTENDLTLYISAIIKGLEWDTVFKFNRKEVSVLMRDILPYFESIENYEKCAEIKNLYLELTNEKEMSIL